MQQQPRVFFYYNRPKFSNNVGFFLLQQTRILQHLGFLPSKTDKDGPTHQVSSFYNREGCYNTLPRCVVYPSTTLPPWTDFYQSVIHFLDSFIRNHIDDIFPSIIMLINTSCRRISSPLCHFVLQSCLFKTTKLIPCKSICCLIFQS